MGGSVGHAGCLAIFWEGFWGSFESPEILGLLPNGHQMYLGCFDCLNERQPFYFFLPHKELFPSKEFKISPTNTPIFN